jgi:hypothetical protein
LKKEKLCLLAFLAGFAFVVVFFVTDPLLMAVDALVAAERVNLAIPKN